MGKHSITTTEHVPNNDISNETINAHCCEKDVYIHLKITNGKRTHLTCHIDIQDNSGNNQKNIENIMQQIKQRYGIAFKNQPMEPFNRIVATADTTSISQRDYAIDGILDFVKQIKLIKGISVDVAQ